jgi:photosystem II stability/assembly factor-like uncharacterized protein
MYWFFVTTYRVLSSYSLKLKGNAMMSLSRLSLLFCMSCFLFFLVFLMNGCSTFGFPSVDEMPLTINGETFDIHNLVCNDDGTVAAVGFVQSVTNFRGVALHSSDQGLSWKTTALGPDAKGVFLSMVTLPPRENSSKQVLYASGHAYSGNVAGILLKSFTFMPFTSGPWWKSIDDGRSWQQVDDFLPLVSTREIGAKLPDILVVDSHHTLLTIRSGSGVFNQSAMLRSTDGGKEWQVISLPDVLNYYSMRTDRHGRVAVVGTIKNTGRHNHRIFWSENSGATWNQRPDDPSIPVGLSETMFRHQEDFHFQVGLYGDHGTFLFAYAVPEGVFRQHDWYKTIIYRSNDWGKTWKKTYWASWSPITSMAGNGKGRLVALTFSGSVLLSDDSGVSWTAHETGFLNTSIFPGRLIEAGDGILLGLFQGSRFIRSTDWGNTWHIVDSKLPDRKYYLGPSCTNSSGLVVTGGGFGMVTRSIDGGATWQRARIVDDHFPLK